MTAKKSTKTGKNFRGGGEEFFWLARIYTPEEKLRLFFDFVKAFVSVLNFLPFLNPGVYILASQKNISPRHLKLFPVFVIFFRSFKLHKGILMCVLSLFTFSSFPPFFMKSSFKFFPVFQLGKWPEYISLWLFCCCKAKRFRFKVSLMTSFQTSNVM